MLIKFPQLNNLTQLAESFYTFGYVKKCIQFLKYARKEEEEQRDAEVETVIKDQIELWRGEFNLILDSQAAKYEYCRQLTENIKALQEVKSLKPKIIDMLTKHNQQIDAKFKRSIELDKNIKELKKKGKRNLFMEAELRALNKSFPIEDGGYSEEGISKLTISTDFIDEKYRDFAFLRADAGVDKILAEFEPAMKVLMKSIETNATPIENKQIADKPSLGKSGDTRIRTIATNEELKEYFYKCFQTEQPHDEDGKRTTRQILNDSEIEHILRAGFSQFEDTVEPMLFKAHATDNLILAIIFKCYQKYAIPDDKRQAGLWIQFLKDNFTNFHKKEKRHIGKHFNKDLLDSYAYISFSRSIINKK